MKKIAIILLSILVAGMFIACNQDVTVDAQVHANIELGTFVLDGKNYATLQEAVNAKLGKSAKALGDNDGVIYLTRNASGPGAVIDSLIDGGVTINFAGYTYSFTNVTGLQGGDDPKPETFGLAITNGAQVTLKGLEQIDLFDTTTTDLTMVYVEGTGTSLAIEDAPKMKVEDDQYVFWARNGANLTIGGKDATESATVTGKVAATGTALQMPSVTVQGSTTITGAVEATTANIKMDDNAAVTGTIEVANTQVLVDGESKIEASLKATDSANVTINSKDNVITTLDKTSNSTVTITETIKVEEVSSESEDSTIVIAGDGNVQVVDEEGTQQTEMEDRTTQQDAVAVIGKVLYATLDEAVSAAKSGETIKILKDIEQGHGYVIEKDLSIDTNGKTITFPEDGATTVATNSRAFKITSGTLTVYGGGTIDAQGKATSATGTAGTGFYGAFRAEVGTELYLESITLKNYRPWGLNVKILGAYAELNNVTITSVCGGGIEVTDDDGAAGNVKGYAKLTNCTMTQSDYRDWCSVPVSVSGNSVIDVYSTSYSGEYGVYIFSSGGTANIYGGEFESHNNHPVLITGTDHTSFPDAVSTINVFDGRFTGSFTCPESDYDFIKIYGGIFDHNPTAYVAEGYVAVQSGSIWTVEKRTSGEARILGGDIDGSDLYFETLEKAIAYADPNAEIELLKSISRSSIVEINKSISLDGCGYTINTSANRGIWLANSNIDVTISNLTLTGTTNTERGIQVNSNMTGVKLTLNDVTVDPVTYYCINFCGGTDVELEINGGSFSGWGSLNIWSNGVSVVAKDAVFIGLNDKPYNADGWNNFGTIILEADTTKQTHEGASNMQVELINCTIKAEQTTGNKQFLICYNSNSGDGAYGNSVLLESCALETYDSSFYFLDNGTNNSLAWTDITMNGQAYPNGSYPTPSN